MAAIVGSRRVTSKQQKVINKFLIKRVIPPLFGLFIFSDVVGITLFNS